MTDTADKTLLLSEQGADRTSAYHMSTKFASDGEQLWVTWLANPYEVRISQVDLARWTVAAEIPLAQGYDNHCGASLALERSGRLHAIVGAHHQAFIHRFSSTPAERHSWSLPHTVGRVATYPSTALSNDDRHLHLAYRASASTTDPWTLVYQRADLRANPPTWSRPFERKTLLRAPGPGYCYWTNSLAIDSRGTLHLLAEFYKQHIKPHGFSPAVTHLYSEDDGSTWRHTDGRDLTSPPAGLEQITPILFRGGGDLRPSGLRALHDDTLAFTMVDPKNQHLLFCRRPSGPDWEIFAWTEALRRHLPRDFVLCSHASLAEDAEGRLHGCAVVAPGSEYQFGHPESRLIHILVDRNRESVEHAHLLPRWRDDQPDWLPSLHPAPAAAGGRCLLLHQSGQRGEGCINPATTHVVLRLL